MLGRARQPTSVAVVFLTQSDLLPAPLPQVTVELPSLSQTQHALPLDPRVLAGQGASTVTSVPTMTFGA
jgi:hypothetical protein